MFHRFLASCLCPFVVVVALLCVTHSGAADPPGEGSGAGIGWAGAPSPPGLVVHVGAKGLSVPIEWAQGGLCLVEQLVTSQDAVEGIHARAREAGVTGLVSASIWNSGTSNGRLPFTDNMVDRLIVRDPSLVSREEAMRVLVPGTGWAIFVVDGTLESVNKPMPDAYDEWPQYDYNAARTQISHDTAIGVPTGLQWKAGRDRSLGKSGSSGLRIAAGRVLHHADAGKEEEVVARNAWNGLPLWRFANRFDEPDYAPLIAGHDFDYALLGEGEPLAALDPMTGEVHHRYTQGGVNEETGRRSQAFMATRFDNRIIIANGPTLLVAEAGSDKTLWKHEEKGFWAQPLVAEKEGLVVAVLAERPRGTGRWGGSSGSESVVAFDLATGEERWRNDDIKGNTISSIAYANGVIGYFQAIGISAAGGGQGPDEKFGALDAATGGISWKKKYPEKLTAQVLMMRGTDLIIGEGGGYWAFDQRTGEETSQWKYDSNVNCSRIRGTDEWFIFSSTTFLSPDDLAYRRWITRSVCATGAFPAYGMSYFVPNGCHCFTQVSGYLGLHSREAAPEVPDDARLTREPGRVGPSSASDSPRHAAAREGVDPAKAWLQWNATARRTRAVEGELGDVKPAWSLVVTQPTEIKGSPILADWDRTQESLPILTQPVSDGRTVIVAAPYEHAVVAIDAATGEERWRWHAGGIIDSTPPIYEGTTIVGSRDGYVTCLDLRDGSERWRFLAAPLDERIVVDGQIESRWPAVGAVLIHDGAAWVSAGRHPELAYGLTVYQLDPTTGAIQWKYRNTGHPESLAPRKPGESWPDDLKAGENMRQQHNLRQGMMTLFGDDGREWVGLSGLAFDPHPPSDNADAEAPEVLTRRDITRYTEEVQERRGEMVKKQVRYTVGAYYRGDDVASSDIKDVIAQPRLWPFRLSGFPSDHGHSMDRFLDGGGREYDEDSQITALAMARGEGGWFTLDAEQRKTRALGPQVAWWPDGGAAGGPGPQWRTSVVHYKSGEARGLARCGDRIVATARSDEGHELDILDAATGELLATHPIEGPPLRGSVSAMPGLVLVCDADGRISAFRP